MHTVRALSAIGLSCLIFPALSTSPTSAARLPPPCVQNQLVILASGTQGFAGTGAMAFVIANRGASCRIGGYAQVKFFNAKGVAVDHRDVHESSMVFAEPRSVTVILAHGGAASLGVSWSDNTVNNLPLNRTCPMTVSVSVVLLHGVGHLSGLLQSSTRPCNGWLDATPIEPGAWPRQNG